MKRPNLGNGPENENEVAMKLEPTIEEDGSEEQLMIDSGTVVSPNNCLPDFKQENDDSILMPGAFPLNDYGNGLIQSPTANCVTDYTSSLSSPQPLTTVSACDISNNNPSYTNLDSAPQSIPVPMTNYGAVPLSGSTMNTIDSKTTYPNKDITTSGHAQGYSMSSNGDMAPTTSPTITKPKSSSRKNAWGNMSYADLITQGIESSPDKRLTLAQIYDWMVKNVPYFKDKGDSNSSAGWKVIFF